MMNPAETGPLRFTCIACHKPFVVEDWDEMVQLRTLDVFREPREDSTGAAPQTENMLDLTCPRCGHTAAYTKSEGED
jgi:transposase-like protein